MSSAVLGYSTPVQILSFAAADGFHQKQLQSDEACYVMEVLQTELDRLRTHKVAERRKYLKSMRYLNRVHGVLPPSMFLTGLTRESATAVAGGGFADVWIGRLDKQRVCIKVLRFFQQGSDREKLLKVLSKEVLLWRQLNHPNILPFLGVNTDLFAPSFCIVSPWMSNGDIMAYAQNRSLDLSAKLKHIRQIAKGLLYLHELDPPVIHGDIKGANILISDDQRCCLADFGLSVLDTQSMNPTVTATVQGSLRWLAPEFINPSPMPTQGKLTSRDIYAFGCTIFEILTGHPPFSHHNLDITVAIDVLKGVRPVLSSAIVPKEAVFKLICALLDSCWAEKNTHRPDAQTVHDFLQHIHTFLRIPELECFPSLLPVLNGASGIRLNPSGQHPLNDCGLSTTDALDPVAGNTHPSSGLSSPGTVHSSFVRAEPSPELLPEHSTGVSSGVHTPATFAKHRGISGSDLSALDQDGFASRKVKMEGGIIIKEWNLEAEELAVPSSASLKQSRSTFIKSKAKTIAVQPIPVPSFEASSSVISRSIQEIPSLTPSHQILPPGRTYKSTPKDADGVVRDRIFTPFDEDDEDDKIVWDPRPTDILSTPAHIEALDDEVDQKNINPILNSDRRAVPRFHHASAFNSTGQPLVHDPKLLTNQTRRPSEFDSMVASDNNALSTKTPAPEDFHSSPAIHHKKPVDGLNRVHASHQSIMSYSQLSKAEFYQNVSRECGNLLSRHREQMTLDAFSPATSTSSTQSTTITQVLPKTRADAARRNNFKAPSDRYSSDARAPRHHSDVVKAPAVADLSRIGDPGVDGRGEGGLSWTNPSLWQVWKEYRDRLEDQPEPGPEDSVLN